MAGGHKECPVYPKEQSVYEGDEQARPLGVYRPEYSVHRQGDGNVKLLLAQPAQKSRRDAVDFHARRG